MAATENIHDAAIVGGGIVGLAAALALASAGHRVALVERTPPTRQRGALGFDIRTLALTPDAAAFVCDLGADLDVMAPIRAMHVWEFDGTSSLTFEHPGALARVAENSDITAALWGAAERRLTLFAPTSVVGVDASPGHMTLALEDVPAGERGSTVSARLLVAADGESSVVRALSGVAVRREPTPRHGMQRALATIAKTRRPHGDTAWQRFGATGPVALLPLTDEHHVAVIWSASESVSTRLAALDDAAFIAALAEETEGVTDGFEAVDRRVSFPLQQTLAADLNPSPRTLIIGDAARTLHPLAGQGVNVGLEDVRALAAQAAAGGDLGAAGRWGDFARARRVRSKVMIAAMRALLTAYCGANAANPWMRLARNATIRRIDASPNVKAHLIREAFGLGPLADFGEGPKSAKGS
ncbi:MAG: FAD-dependent monooxygenase [Gammaproteobacteria bacterium]|nr:FAD-dependent monooxygenase [Gammaproteobacteria bacterium]